MSKHKSFTLEELAKATGSLVIGDSGCSVDNLSTIENANENSITFLSNKKYASSIEQSKACAVIVSSDFKEDGNCNYLKSSDPYLAYAKISKLFKIDDDVKIPFVHKSAVISDKAKIHKNVEIGPFCYVGSNV